MEFSAEIFVKGDSDNLAKALAAEERVFERSSYSFAKKGDGVEFKVKARDAVALRATLNSIAQLLIVFEGGKKNG
jgi:tRNA threonylcarbamoyladenosine modification (KEOPS) complex  Pcc1 subunit